MTRWISAASLALFLTAGAFAQEDRAVEPGRLRAENAMLRASLANLQKKCSALEAENAKLKAGEPEALEDNGDAPKEEEVGDVADVLKPLGERLEAQLNHRNKEAEQALEQARNKPQDGYRTWIRCEGAICVFLLELGKRDEALARLSALRLRIIEELDSKNLRPRLEKETSTRSIPSARRAQINDGLERGINVGIWHEYISLSVGVSDNLIQNRAPEKAFTLLKNSIPPGDHYGTLMVAEELDKLAPRLAKPVEAKRLAVQLYRRYVQLWPDYDKGWDRIEALEKELKAAEEKPIETDGATSD